MEFNQVYICLAVLTMFSAGVSMFVFNSKHLLTALVSLEFTTLALFLTVTLISPFEGSSTVSLAFLTVSVCEGALGLSALVLYARRYGSESLETSAFAVW